MMKKYVLGLTVIFGLVLSGCTSDKKEDTTKESVVSEKIEKVTVTDSNGEKLEINQDPKKVVVFDMGALDTIRELGKEDTVIGAPLKTLPTYLDSYKGVENAGGMKEPDLEKINAMQPELIIISGRQEDMKQELEKIAPTLYLDVDNKEAWQSTMANIETIGTIYDKEDEAKEKVQELTVKRDNLRKMTEKSGKTGLMSLVNEG